MSTEKWKVGTLYSDRGVVAVDAPFEGGWLEVAYCLDPKMAARIVDAVNGHADLLEALKGTHQAAKMMADYRGSELEKETLAAIRAARKETP